MGSAVYAGIMPVEQALSTIGDDGTDLAAAVAALRSAMPEARPRSLGTPFAALFEAHIEQGPELEAGGETIGVVTGMQGNRRFTVEVVGKEDHSGTTPRRLRRDAFVDAIAIARALQELCRDEADILRFTIGRFDLYPNAVTVVPGKAAFTVDLRHPEAAVLDHLAERMPELARGLAVRCTVEMRLHSQADPVSFVGTVTDAVARSAVRRGYPHRPIHSGAGHDARYFPPLWPTGMLFIPCEGGVSHNERENADPAHVAAGAQVVTDVMLDLAATL